MSLCVKTTGLVAVNVTITAVLVGFIIPGCTQNQDNSPISITNSQGRPSLSVTCSMDGSVAYVTDGRNVYRYERQAPDHVETWRCILSHVERLELANRHDSREELPSPQ
jgi:alkylated DNA repair dioxygenase AlkB